MPRVVTSPFDRQIPSSESSDSPRPVLSPDSNMLAHQLPFLPLPSGLDFGSDPRPGFTDPNRYGNVTRLRPNPPLGGSHPERSLPPVSHLLSPVSPPGADVPYFPPRFGSGSPTESSSGYHSPHPSEFSVAPPYPRQETSVPPFPRTLEPFSNSQYASTTRDPMPRGNPTVQYPQSHRPQDAAPGGYFPSLNRWDPPRQPHHPHSSQPVQNQMYRPAPTSGPMPAQYSRDVPCTTKPLPKVVGERIFPGEGPCYVYEDGSHVKKFIDGEVVNAQWGVTRAGKPRRRLAMACLTCREKKIKCEPGDVKCAPCDKSGRECQYQLA